MQLSFADLFAGGGGFSHGFHDHGRYALALAADNWKWAELCYQQNMPESRFLRADLSEPDIRSSIASELKGCTDVLIGGPPCQDFSTLGKRPDGSRKNQLVDAYADLVRRIAPAVIMMENVRGFRSKLHPSGRRFPDELKRRLSAGRGARYVVEDSLLNTLDFGLAQTRTRYFLFGVREDLQQKTEIMSCIRRTVEARKVNVVNVLKNVISDLPRIPAGGGGRELRLKSKVHYNHQALNHSDDLVARFRCVPAGGGLLDVPDALLTTHLVRMKEGAYGSGGHVKNIYGRLVWDEPCGTIVAGMDKITCGRYVHPVDHRLLTPRECARIQGYPDNFVFPGGLVTQYYLIGNSVPPPMSAIFADAVASSLGVQGMLKAA